MMNQSRLVDGLLRQTPRLTEFGLVVLLAWMVAGWIVSDQGDQTDVGGVSTLPIESKLPDLSSLANTSLFGAIVKAAVAPKPVAQPVQVSRLNLKLLGTVVAGEHSAAIVKLGGSREQNVFFIGDAVQPGVKLHDVEADAIVVERNGKLERIVMDEGARLNGASHRIANPTRPAVHRMQRRVNRKQLQSQIQDFPKLLSQARVIPHYIDGKADGFTITNIVPGSLYTQVGLRNGDIIRKVNGQQVTSAQQAMAMYQALQSSPSIDVELMRAGQVQNVHYDIR